MITNVRMYSPYMCICGCDHESKEINIRVYNTHEFYMGCHIDVYITKCMTMLHNGYIVTYNGYIHRYVSTLDEAINSIISISLLHNLVNDMGKLFRQLSELRKDVGI